MYKLPTDSQVELSPSERVSLRESLARAIPEVSVVIPCLNEEKSIGACVEKALAAFAASGMSGEVVVADNGSTDDSVSIAALHGARVVHARVKGYGSALRKGIEEAQGAFVILGDADGSHDFSEIPRFIEKWRQGFEFVIGNRFQGEIKEGAMSWHHKYLGTPVLSGLLDLFFGAGVGDINCGMRGMTKELCSRLDFRTTGMEFASESLIKAAKVHAKIAEVPITMWPDLRERDPHLRTFRDGWRHLRFMLLSAPNWLFLLPGALLVALGLGLVLWLLPGPRLAGRVGLDIHTIALSMMLTLLGVHIISIGLFVKVFSFTEKLRLDRLLAVGGCWLRDPSVPIRIAFAFSLSFFSGSGSNVLFYISQHAGNRPRPTLETKLGAHSGQRFASFVDFCASDFFRPTQRWLRNHCVMKYFLLKPSNPARPSRSTISESAR